MNFLHRPLYIRYPKANESEIIKIAQCSIVGHCLEEAIVDFIRDERNKIESEYRQFAFLNHFPVLHKTSRSPITTRIRGAFTGDLDSQYVVSINDEFRQVIMSAFYKAVLMTHWDDMIIPNIQACQRHREPPAALLHGKLQNFNRVEKRWRISISEAKIRPRIDLEPNDQCKTLWDASGNYIENIHKNKHTIKLKSLEKTVKLDGEIILLAYDDF